jgi:predicted RNase H-like nuclease (RuvC/YqgF family)
MILDSGAALVGLMDTAQSHIRSQREIIRKLNEEIHVLKRAAAKSMLVEMCFDPRQATINALVDHISRQHDMIKKLSKEVRMLRRQKMEDSEVLGEEVLHEKR